MPFSLTTKAFPHFMPQIRVWFDAALRHSVLIRVCFVSSLALVIGCGGERANRFEEDPERVLREQSGSAEFSVEEQIEMGRAGELDHLSFFEKQVTDSMLSELGAEDLWLKTIRFDRGEITDRGIESIAMLPSIRHLRLRESPITDKGMEKLSRCESLQILNLPQCKATAKGVEALATLPRLSNLRLGGDLLTSETAEAVAKIKSLRSVHLIGVPIDDAGLKTIAALPELESLYLDDVKVSEEGWDWLFREHGDLHLHVNQKHLDRDPGKHD